MKVNVTKQILLLPNTIDQLGAITTPIEVKIKNKIFRYEDNVEKITVSVVKLLSNL